ncbi:MAG: hypothetical protein AABX34_06655, partial [Nanoarchaeota archaeon]
DAKDAKNRLTGDLETERKYLKIMRDRIKDISALLDITSGEIKRIQKANRTNLKIMGDLDTLNGILNEFKIIFKYIARKINTIQERVETGDRLLKGKLTDSSRLFAGLTELYDEKMDDDAIIKVLMGGGGTEPRTKWQKLKYMLALDIKTREGMDVSRAVSNLNPDELPKDLNLIAEVISLIFSFFKIFANYEISSEQKEK